MLHLGLPVRVGGLMVNNGDLLHGDAKGVTNIPLDIVEEVAGIADEFIATEDIIMDYVKADGDKCVDKFNELRAEFQDAVAKLKSRVERS